jgi:hypothetical protein
MAVAAGGWCRDTWRHGAGIHACVRDGEVRHWRDGNDYRLEVDELRVRLLRRIDSKWATLEFPEDEEVRDQLTAIMAMEIRRFDHRMAMIFRNYK